MNEKRKNIYTSSSKIYKNLIQVFIFCGSWKWRWFDVLEWWNFGSMRKENTFTWISVRNVQGNFSFKFLTQTLLLFLRNFSHFLSRFCWGMMDVNGPILKSSFDRNYFNFGNQCLETGKWQNLLWVKTNIQRWHQTTFC